MEVQLIHPLDDKNTPSDNLDIPDVLPSANDSIPNAIPPANPPYQAPGAAATPAGPPEPPAAPVGEEPWRTADDLADAPLPPIELHRKKKHKKMYPRDELSRIIWALILIWVGLNFLAANVGLGSPLMPPQDIPGWVFIRHAGSWAISLVGAGALLLLEVAIRLVVPRFKRPISGTLILAAVLGGLGLTNLLGWGLVMPFVIIAIGISIVLRNVGAEKA